MSSSCASTAVHIGWWQPRQKELTCLEHRTHFFFDPLRQQEVYWYTLAPCPLFEMHFYISLERERERVVGVVFMIWKFSFPSPKFFYFGFGTVRGTDVSLGFLFLTFANHVVRYGVFCDVWHAKCIFLASYSRLSLYLNMGMIDLLLIRGRKAWCDP